MASDSVFGTLYNADAVPINNGELVRVSGTNRCVLAQADSSAHVQGLAGASISGIVGIGGPVNAASNGFSRYVRLEAGLAPVAGDILYVSATTAGRATNVAPANAVSIGTIEDTTSYSLNGRVRAVLSIAGTLAGTFPGFYAGTMQPIGPSALGSSGLVARGDHQHPWLQLADVAALSAIATGTMFDGTQVYVSTFKDVFELQTTSAAASGNRIVAANGSPGKKWFRLFVGGPQWATQTGWEVDTATGSDEASGAPGSPLRTVSELAYRLSWTRLTSNITCTLIGSMQAGDDPAFMFRCNPGVTFTITGQLTQIYASTVGVSTAAAAGPGVGDNNITDPAVPAGSFTAAGALADGVLGVRTAGGFFWFAKDKGATTARISKPTTAIANGDAYSANTMPTIRRMAFLETAQNTCVIEQCVSNAQTWLGGGLRFTRCWFIGGTLPGCVYSTCAFSGSPIIALGAGYSRNANLLSGCMARGTGAQSLTFITLSYITIGNNQGITLQGCNITVQGGYAVFTGDVYANDYTGAGGGVVTASYWGQILFSTAGTGIVGSGNTNYLFYADRMSQIASTPNPVVVAGSSPSATPIHSTGVPDFSVANMANGAGGLGPNGNGVYYTNTASAPALTGVAGAVGGAAVRSLVIPDGAGGFYTVNSST